MSMVILSDGHDLIAWGAANETYGLREHYEAMKVNDLVEKFLQNEFEVVRINADGYMAALETVHNPAATSLKWKVRQINAITTYHPDTVVIETHFNAFNRKTTGHEVEYWHTSERGRELAQALETAMTELLPNPARGIRPRDDLYLLRETIFPAVIVEPLFIDCDEDARLLLSESGRELVARAIATGVESYFRRDFV